MSGDSKNVFLRYGDVLGLLNLVSLSPKSWRVKSVEAASVAKGCFAKPLP